MLYVYMLYVYILEGKKKDLNLPMETRKYQLYPLHIG